jgi:hypothetical protein
VVVVHLLFLLLVLILVMVVFAVVVVVGWHAPMVPCSVVALHQLLWVDGWLCRWTD